MAGNKRKNSANDGAKGGKAKRSLNFHEEPIQNRPSNGKQKEKGKNFHQASQNLHLGNWPKEKTKTRKGLNQLGWYSRKKIMKSRLK